MRGVAFALLLACGTSKPAVCNVPLDMPDFDTARMRYPALADTCLLSLDANGAPVDHPEALRYDLNTPLFSDYAAKHRTLWLPPGTAATYSGDGVFDLPVGSIITKTFVQSGVVIETRLLIRGDSEWFALPYVWRDGVARLALGGETLPLSATKPDGSAIDVKYAVPNANQCAQCHARLESPNNKKIQPIGITARSLNRAGQLQAWAAAGKLEGLPASPPVLADFTDTAQPLEARARAWLEMNCAHCHRREGEASNTGLYLLASETDVRKLGFCKSPVSAGAGSGGRLYAIWPGQPNDSIVVFRVESTKPAEMMPELGRSVVHSEGAALVREWITSLSGDCP